MTDVKIIEEDVEGYSDIKLIKVIGSLDTSNSDNLAYKVEEIIKENISRIIIDFEQLEYFNSTAMGILINCSRKLNRRNGNLVLLNVNEDSMSIFEITGASPFFLFANTIDEAISKLR